VSVAMQRTRDGGSAGNALNLRVPPGRMDIDGHRYLDTVQSFCQLAACRG
jgi:hypothetical protein